MGLVLDCQTQQRTYRNQATHQHASTERSPTIRQYARGEQMPDPLDAAIDVNAHPASKHRHQQQHQQRDEYADGNFHGRLLRISTGTHTMNSSTAANSRPLWKPSPSVNHQPGSLSDR